MQDSEHGRWIRVVVEQYEPALLRYAAHLTGNLDLGRDVVQDTFVKLCQQSPAALDGHLTQWLYTVCRNRALDLCRKERRMKTMSAVQVEEQPCPITSPVAVLEQQESTDQVLRFMDRLSENQREVVRLKFQSGLSYREIAAVTQLSVTNVGVLLHTAIKKLREELGNAS
jgi:RNA polymerase sigma factor (sigma-70 family)